jgi:hypothetical protein
VFCQRTRSHERGKLHEARASGTSRRVGPGTGSRLGMRFSARLPHACPECNGCVDLESMLCEGCGLALLQSLTVPDVYALLYPGPRIRDVDTFIDDVLSGESS